MKICAVKRRDPHDSFMTHSVTLRARHIDALYSAFLAKGILYVALSLY